MPILLPSRWNRCVGVLSVLLAVGCGGNAADPQDEPVPTAAPLVTPDGDAPATGLPSAEAPYEKRLNGITLTVPAGWVEKTPSSGFLDAEFRLPGEGGDARLTLSSAAGGAEANAQRWIGQFQRGPDDPEPLQTNIDAGGTEAILVDVSGTFDDGFRSAGGPQPDSRLLGAIIPVADRHVFVKLTGPKSTVAAREAEFRTFVESARFD